MIRCFRFVPLWFAFLPLAACLPNAGEEKAGGDDPNSPPTIAERKERDASDLLLDETGWAEVRARSTGGLGAALKAELLSDAEAWLEAETDPYRFGRPYEHYEHLRRAGQARLYDARVFARQVTDLAVAARLTGDSRFTEQAAAILESAARQHDSAYYAAQNALAVGDALYGTCLAYAWLEDDLDPDVRDVVRAHIRELGQWLADNSARKFWGRDQLERYVHNWNSVTHAPLGLAGFVLDEPEWIDRAEGRIEAFFRHSLDRTGAGFEGANYLAYGFGAAVPFAVELKRRTGRDLFEEFPKTRKASDYLLWTLEPWGAGVVELNQTPRSVKNSGWLFYFISRYRDADGLWAWRRLYGDPDEYGGDGSLGSYGPHHFPSTAFALLWHDPALEPTEPETADTGKLKVFERGIAIARDGWETEDTLLTFVSAKSYGAVWNHPDANSFTFHSLGERFAADAGAHALESTDHNTILVEGRGMDSQGGPQPAPGAILEASKAGERVILRGDATEAYAEAVRAKEALRDIGLELGESPHLLVSDRFQATLGGEASTVYTWNLVTGDGNEILLSRESPTATIIGARNGALCDLTVLYPANPDMEVIPAEGRTPPRLLLHQKARTGRFLVALAPRREGEAPAEIRFETSPGPAPTGTVHVTPADGQPTRWKVMEGEIKGTP